MDVLVLTALFLVTTLYVLYLYLTPGYSKIMGIFLFIVYSLPLAGFLIVIFYVLVKNTPFAKSAKQFVSRTICNKFQLPSSKETDPDNLDDATDSVEVNHDLPDHVVHADDYLNTYIYTFCFELVLPTFESMYSTMITRVLVITVCVFIVCCFHFTLNLYNQYNISVCFSLAGHA